MSNRLREEAKRLFQDKILVIALCVVAFLSYAYLWTHPSMGVDDTAMPRYFVEGFAPHLGRWTIFVLSKVFHMIDFTPVVTDLLGVVFMAAAAAGMAGILRKSSGDRLPRIGTTVFAVFFISYPLINEVYAYYLHNGLGMGYLWTTLVYYLLRFEKKGKATILSLLLFTLSLSCYETFAEVLLLLFFLDTMVRISYEDETMTWKAWWGQLFYLAAVIVCSLLLRNGLNRILLWVIGVEPHFHSITEGLAWLFSSELVATIARIIRGFGRYYVLNATVNQGIFMFWVSMMVIAVYGIRQAIHRKSFLLFLNLLGTVAISWVITVIEGNIGAYRTMQTFPVLIGFSMMIAYTGLSKLEGKRILKNLGFVLLGILLYNQIYETNKWYYVDYLKYKEEADICRELAWDIRKEATTDKPIIFIGRITDYGTNDTYMYVKESSWQYRLFSMVDANREEGKKYEIVQNPVWYAVFDWGTDAFEEHATEIANFFAYEGYPITVASMEEKSLVKDFADEMPVWPSKGSIMETEDYVVVKIGPVQEKEYVR